jgi:exopolysaccharide biosynthesis protein
MFKMPIFPRLTYLYRILLPAFSLVWWLTVTDKIYAQNQPPLLSPSVNQSSPAGNQLSLNGRIVPGAWVQQVTTGGKLTTYVNDGVLRQLMGVDLLSTTNPASQPVQWFSSTTKPVMLGTKLSASYRYLDITQLAKTAGWQIQANGQTLTIATPSAKVLDVRQGKQSSGDRLVVDLDRPTLWQVRQELPRKRVVDADAVAGAANTPPNRDWTITLDGIAAPGLLQRYTNPTATPSNLRKQLPSTSEPLLQKVEVVKNQTILRLSVPFGQSVRVTTIDNPNRLVIDVRPDALVEKDITLTTGLRWRQRFVNVGTARFPVVWLEINPRAGHISLKPMWTNQQTLSGTAPLIQTAQNYAAIAAINGGYFNRNNRLPLGAIRRDNQWISGPILNRGAIAWNDAGGFYVGRLTLTETLVTSNNQRLPVILFNSGYIQNGIARYTSNWGTNYTPLSDNETIITIQNNQVTNQLAGGKAGANPVPIPQNGYLLVLRGNAINASQLPTGTTVQITSTTTPAEFSRYPHIIAAGPLLVQNRQIVLDAKAEKFSDAFIRERAVRSSICTTTAGNLIIAAVHSRAGGPGPTLAEQAQLMQTVGCVNALNLDGGSSTSLYLSGQLLDRSPNTAARVHNGIGIFLEPK